MSWPTVSLSIAYIAQLVNITRPHLCISPKTVWVVRRAGLVSWGEAWGRGARFPRAGRDGIGD